MKKEKEGGGDKEKEKILFLYKYSIFSLNWIFICDKFYFINKLRD